MKGTLADFIVAGRFIKTYQNKIYKYMISIFKQMCSLINQMTLLTNITVTSQNIEANSSIYIEFDVKNKDKDP